MATLFPQGLARVARRALIMISVLGSFVLNADPTVKQFGVGLSVGLRAPVEAVPSGTAGS